MRGRYPFSLLIISPPLAIRHTGLRPTYSYLPPHIKNRVPGKNGNSACLAARIIVIAPIGDPRLILDSGAETAGARAREFGVDGNGEARVNIDMVMKFVMFWFGSPSCSFFGS